MLAEGPWREVIAVASLAPDSEGTPEIRTEERKACNFAFDLLERTSFVRTGDRAESTPSPRSEASEALPGPEGGGHVRREVRGVGKRTLNVFVP